ncbi:MAG: hypothetical protein O9264_01060 [Leptospira sp.]|nr:hypothetical protein [Leptospira sp.]
MNPIKKINLIVCLLLFPFLSHCRNDELDVIKTYSPTQNPIFGLVYYILPGQGFSFSGGGGGSLVPNQAGKTENSKFILWGASNNVPAIWSTNDGSTFNSKITISSIPNCSNQFVSGGESRFCRVISFASAGTTNHAIIASATYSGNPSSATSLKLYYGTSGTDNSYSFNEITADLGITISNVALFSGAWNGAADSSGNFALIIKQNTVSNRLCGRSVGGNWVCEASTSGSAVRNLNGTIYAGYGRRWNGTGFENAATNGGGPDDLLQIGSRILFSIGSGGSYTTDALPWNGAITLTASTIPATGINNFSPRLVEVTGQPFRYSQDSPKIYYRSTTDLGNNYSSISEISDISYSRFDGYSIGSIGGKVILIISGNRSGETTFSTKIFSSTNGFSNWTEITP